MTTSLVLVKLKTLRNLFHFSSLLKILLCPKQPNNHKHGDALCSSSNNFKRLVISYIPRLHLLSSEDSISVLRTSTKSPGLKFKSLMVCLFSISYLSNQARFLSATRTRISSTCCRCFAKAIARKPINSAVDKTRPGNSTNHVASWISKGKIGCAPVVIKNGEQPKYFHIVILSAHKTRKKNQNHFAGLPPVAFQSICRRSQWGLSIFPFALELYEDILIPLIPYFFSNQATAARYTLALSVTIFRIHPQRHIISSNNHIPTDRAVSSLNGQPSAHEVIPHLP